MDAKLNIVIIISKPSPVAKDPAVSEPIQYRLSLNIENNQIAVLQA